MHIPDGTLAAPVWTVGLALGAAGTALGLHKTDYERLPRVALTTAALFIASLVHVPIGPVSEHLVLNGLAGVLLGWAVFPAFAVALLLQVLFFQSGGYTTLGVNTLNMAAPAVVCYYLFGRPIARWGSLAAAACAFLAGGLAIVLGCSLLVAELHWSGMDSPAILVAVAHLPLIAVEGVVTVITVRFLRSVRPDALGAKPLEEKPRA